MSFFDSNVIAKEQLHGVGAAPPAPPVPVVVEPAGAPQKKKPKPILKWLRPIRDYLQWKVSA